MRKLLGRLIREEEGQGLTEYALILSGIAIAVIATLVLLGDWIQETFQNVLDELTTEAPTS